MDALKKESFAWWASITPGGGRAMVQGKGGGAILRKRKIQNTKLTFFKISTRWVIVLTAKNLTQQVQRPNGKLLKEKS